MDPHSLFAGSDPDTAVFLSADRYYEEFPVAEKRKKKLLKK